MSESSPERRTSCGLLNAVFGKNKFWPRRANSSSSFPSSPNGSTTSSLNKAQNGGSGGSNSKRRRGGSGEPEIHDPMKPENNPPQPGNKPAAAIRSTAPNHQKMPQVYQQNNIIQANRKTQQQLQQMPGNNNATRTVATARGGSTQMSTRSLGGQNHQQQGNNNRKVPKESIGISGELEMMINEHQRGGGPNLVRASSGNVMLHSHLGNLRQPGTGAVGGNVISNNNANNNNKINNTTSTGRPYSNTRFNQESPKTPNGGSGNRYGNSTMGNIVKKQQNDQQQQLQEKRDQNNSFCRALSCRMDPEELKILGNEDYKNGRFAEALALYERAVDIDPNQASYRSNKSAALTALGRLLEAVFECREAIRIEPHYQRAHHRLANLYLRLGEPEKALYHYKQAGHEADPDAVLKAKNVLVHLKKCDEAKRLKDWNTVLKESGNAISAGADSAPMIFALQAEALLKLRRHQDAETALSNGPNWDADQCTKFFGPVGSAALLVIRAQVDMAAGRFEDAIAAVQQAGRLDPSNREVNSVTRRAKAVSAARAQGNELFRSSMFSEACAAYGQGLEHDPYNSILLCNRATCRSKLRHYEKAIEDCTAVLNVRPSYAKARLRRADCNTKLEKWEAAVQDYEMLLRESPGDVDVGRSLFEAQLQLQKMRGEDVKDLKFDDNVIVTIENKERFRHFTTLPGLAVVLFCNKPGDKVTLQLLEQLCKRYLTVKFLKVEVEEASYLLKSEGVSTVPAFQIYRNGSKVKQVAGDDHELLQSSIQEYTS